MDPRIENLPSTTFFGHRLTRRQIADIQETVALCPALSRRELGHTVCEHLGWYTAKGATRVRMGLGLLEQLEDLGILTLPAPRAAMRRGPRRAIARTDRTAPQPAITCALATLTPLTLELVRGRGADWDETVDRYHYLGYTQPFGPYLRYLDPRPRWPRPGLPAVRGGYHGSALPRPLDRLVGESPPAPSAPCREQHAFPCVSLGQRPEPGIPYPLHCPPPPARGLAPRVRTRPRPDRNVR